MTSEATVSEVTGTTVEIAPTTLDGNHLNAHSLKPIARPETRSPLSRLRSLRWYWFLPLAAIPAVAIAGSQIFVSSPEPAPEVQTLPVRTFAVQPVSSYTTQRTYSGEVVARRSSNLGFERGGTIISVLVEEGDRVGAGQPLARLDTRSLDAQRLQAIAQRGTSEAQLQELKAGARQEDINAARASVAEIQQQLELARRKQSRRQYLYDEGAISREALDQEEYNANALQNRLQQAQSNLDELLAGTRKEQVAAQSARVQQIDANIRGIDVELSKSILRAPFSGQVSQRFLDEGAIAGTGTPVLTLVEQGQLEARIGIPSDRADSLAIGTQQLVEIGDRTYQGRVSALLPELDSTSRTVTAVIQLESASDLRVGETARLNLSETQNAEGFLLNSTALIPGERGLWSVYVLGEAGEKPDVYQVARRDVEVLHAEGDRVLVRGTLQAGDRVILDGTHRIVSGQWIFSERMEDEG
ncbi:MAG: efflux RND transporter periplasmic adaptor subunit [Cyanobacteria bacterium P01_E01_bin.42]